MSDVRCRKHFGVYGGQYCLLCALNRIEELEAMLKELINYTNDVLNGPIAQIVEWPDGMNQSPLLAKARKLVLEKDHGPKS